MGENRGRQREHCTPEPPQDEQSFIVMRFLLFLFCLPLAALAAASLETTTDQPQRENFADRSVQQLREIRRTVDAKAGAASQTEALQYQAIYAALARCDDLIAQFRRVPEHERAGLLEKFDE